MESTTVTIRHIKTGEIRVVELADWEGWPDFREWDRMPENPTAGVAAVVPGDNGPPPLEAEVEPTP